ncbi:MAG: hypothetical protein JWP40_1235 [Blastococcus sp.]|jgi:hypothetical protein|nr:hypothetical protein [Blastococcus sp.]
MDPTSNERAGVRPQWVLPWGFDSDAPAPTRAR